MRKWRVVLLVALVASLTLAFGYGKMAREKGAWDTPAGYGYVAYLPKGDLSQEERDGILQMIEEEKLARDVYTTLYEVWNYPMFENIAKSEQRHIDAMKVLIERYGLENPVENLGIGEFKNDEIQELYEKLIEQGKVSLQEAIKVGAMIEEMDMKDLEELLKVTDNEDVKFVYENLLNGSKNHLRSLYRTLERFGERYSPKYISDDEFEKIVSSDEIVHGRGRGRFGRGR